MRAVLKATDSYLTFHERTVLYVAQEATLSRACDDALRGLRLEVLTHVDRDPTRARKLRMNIDWSKMGVSISLPRSSTRMQSL